MTRKPRLTAWAEVARMCVRIPNMGPLILSSVMASLAAGVLSPVMPLFLRDRGITFAGLGLIFSLGAAAPVLLQPIVGWLADRVGRRIMVVGTSFVLSLLLPIYVFIRDVTGFAVIQAARSAVNTSSSPATSAMLGDIIPATDRATLFGVYGSVQTLAYVVALFASGYLLRLGADFNAAFYGSSALFLLSSFVLLFGVRETMSPAGAGAPAAGSSAGATTVTGAGEAKHQRAAGGYLPALADIRNRVRAVFSDRTLLGLVLLRFWFQLGLGGFPIYLPLLAQECGAPREMIGPIVATAWLTFAVMQPIGGRLSDRHRERRLPLMYLGIVLLIINGAALAAARGLLWVVLLWACTGIGDGLFRPGFSALVVDTVPAAQRGSYFGVVGSASTLAGVISPLVCGALAAAGGIQAAFYIAPVSWVLGIASLLLLVRRTGARAAA